jgi:hypothetical protein
LLAVAVIAAPDKGERWIDRAARLKQTLGFLHISKVYRQVFFSEFQRRIHDRLASVPDGHGKGAT